MTHPDARHFHDFLDHRVMPHVITAQQMRDDAERTAYEAANGLPPLCTEYYVDGVAFIDTLSEGGYRVTGRIVDTEAERKKDEELRAYGLRFFLAARALGPGASSADIFQEMTRMENAETSGSSQPAHVARDGAQAPSIAPDQKTSDSDDEAHVSQSTLATVAEAPAYRAVGRAGVRYPVTDSLTNVPHRYVSMPSRPEPDEYLYTTGTSSTPEARRKMRNVERAGIFVGVSLLAGLMATLIYNGAHH